MYKTLPWSLLQSYFIAAKNGIEQGAKQWNYNQINSKCFTTWWGYWHTMRFSTIST